MPQDLWDDRDAHLKDFPDHLLFDIARNDSAQRVYRRHAVEILVVRKSPRVKHPDLADLVAELEIELDGIQFEYPAQNGPGPLVASVTTETMQTSDPPPIEHRLRFKAGSTEPEPPISATAENPTSAEKETECPTTPLSATSDATEKPPSTPTAASGETRTPRSTKKASDRPIS